MNTSLNSSPNGFLAGCRVLVVEDEMMVAWALEDMLSDWGCTVVGPAARVANALTMLDAEAIDVALLDVSLDRQKSYPVADALAAGGVPFALLTGYGRDSLPSRYQTCPVLQKPFMASELGNALAALLISKSRAPA